MYNTNGRNKYFSPIKYDRCKNYFAIDSWQRLAKGKADAPRRGSGRGHSDGTR